MFNRKVIVFVVSILMLVFFSPSTIFAATVNAQANSNGWISVGVPKFIHIGTDGEFYLNGTNEGMCGGVKPAYFRVSMADTYWKEFYSWILTMAAKKKSIQCVVNSGCGQSQVWVKYCRGSLE